MATKKTEYLQIRISEEVKNILARKAELLGMSMSEYARFLILADAKTTVDGTSDKKDKTD